MQYKHSAAQCGLNELSKIKTMMLKLRSRAHET